MVILNQCHILIDIKGFQIWIFSRYSTQYIEDSILLYFNLNNYLMTSLTEVYKVENKIHQKLSLQISSVLRMQKKKLHLPKYKKLNQMEMFN